MEHKGKHWLIVSLVIRPKKKLMEPDEYGRLSENNYYHKHVLKRFNYPSWIIKKYDWYINYWRSKLQIRFPHYKIDTECYGYWPDEDVDFETQKKRQIAAAKAQVSKVLSIMELRRNDLSKQLFQDEEDDPIMIKCRAKLEEKQFKLQQLLMS